MASFILIRVSLVYFRDEYCSADVPGFFLLAVQESLCPVYESEVMVFVQPYGLLQLIFNEVVFITLKEDMCHSLRVELAPHTG